jgi:hypothetical protein
MTREQVFNYILTAALCTLLASASAVYGQALVRTSTNGREFQPERRPTIAPDDVPEGRRFRGANRETIVLRGVLRLPPGNAAEHKLVKLIVHFRTGRNGPTLDNVEAGNFSRSAHIEGDYTRQETRNVFTFNQVPADQLPVRLTITFAGGFDSIIPDQEFVLTRVDAYFPLKTPPVSEKLPGGPAPSAGNNPKPPLAIPPGNINAVIYAVSTTDHLIWFRHEGMEDGTFRWASSDAQVVGNGWDLRHVFSPGGGVIYAVTSNGDLLWYHHDGVVDGTFRWSSSEGKKVASGWNYKQVFAAGGGVIYAINDDGDLLWFHHSGQREGSLNWTSTQGRVVDRGWNFKRVFSGGGGVIYALTSTGDLLWYRHDGRAGGGPEWGPNKGAKVGTGWTVDQIFSSGNGVIYAINSSKELIWFRHIGFADGSPTWVGPGGHGSKVGSGWEVKHIFSGANLRP